MVTREEFARVQQIIRRKNNSIPHQKQRPEFPLRGLVHCDCCLRYLTSSFSRGRSRRYPYYHCSNKPCERYGKSYPARIIHDEFESFLDKVTPKHELLEKMGELVLRATDEQQAFMKSKKTRLEAERAGVNQQLQELIRMRTQDLVTDQEFLEQKSTLMETRNALESTPVHDDVTGQQLRERLDEIIEPMAQLRETWKVLTGLTRRRFERLLLPVGFVHGKIRTAELGLLFRVFGDFSEGNSTWVAPTGARWNRVLQEILDFSEILQQCHAAKGPSIEVV
jgi:hypothetical protein